MIKAVLFDFDGVLVNSMSFHVQAWQDVYRDFNIEIKPDDILLTEGSKSIDLARRIFAERHVDITDAALKNFVKKKQQRYRQITKAKVENGAEAFMQKLKEQGMLLGLVTGSTLLNVRAILSAELFSFFDAVITGDETRNGKPHPEPYLKAAAQLQVAPDQCLVIENAPLGIQAAKRAGMRVVALTTTLDRTQLTGADFYATDLAELNQNWTKINN